MNDNQKKPSLKKKDEHQFDVSTETTTTTTIASNYYMSEDYEGYKAGIKTMLMQIGDDEIVLNVTYPLEFDERLSNEKFALESNCDEHGVKEPCCERDYDCDGNCDRHPNGN